MAWQKNYQKNAMLDFEHLFFFILVTFFIKFWTIRYLKKKFESLNKNFRNGNKKIKSVRNLKDCVSFAPNTKIWQIYKISFFLNMKYIEVIISFNHIKF